MEKTDLTENTVTTKQDYYNVTARITHSCLILIHVAKITTKLKRLTEIEKLSTTKRARSSALEN